MKTKGLFYIVCTIFSLFVISSCVDNGGAEVGSCSNIECGVGGFCVSGECKCIAGWTGKNCSQRDLPSSIVIERIDIDSFPMKRSNKTSWDEAFGAPDVFLALADSTNTTLMKKTEAQENCKSGNIYSFRGLNWVITSLETEFVVGAYDADKNGEYEFMAGYQFVAVDHIAGTPPVLEAIAPNGTSRMYLYINWNK